MFSQPIFGMLFAGLSIRFLPTNDYLLMAN